MGDTAKGGRPTFQRVPPHDDETERRILGAALQSDDAAEVVAGLDPDEAFYRPRHRHIAVVIAQLVGEGTSCDAGTVGAILRQRGLLDEIGDDRSRGAAYLVNLMATLPQTKAAPRWAEMLRGYAARRRTLGLAGEIIEGVYSDTDTAGLVAEMHEASRATALETTSSWELVNLASILAGDYEEVAPVTLVRSDGQALLYPGKVHAFNAEPEAAKTWLALLACTQEITAGRHALYVDFEAGPVDMVGRLLEMGAKPAEILERFHYVRPEERIDAAARLRIAAVLGAHEISVAIVDGVAEALAMNDWSENDAGDVTRFFVLLPRLLASAGAAVVVIDHLVKDKEGQGRYARGSTAKLAGVTGATYKLEVVRPFARGSAGLAKVIVTKDRHGWVRRAAVGGRVVAELAMASSGDGRAVNLTLRAVDDNGPFRPTGYMERVSRALEGLDATPARQIRTLVTGRNDWIGAALNCLVDEGFMERLPTGGRSVLYRSLRPFRELDEAPAEDPESDEYDPLAEEF